MEIRLLQNLDHGNIVKYLDSIRSDDYLNIILEYVENGSLSSLLGKFQGGGESKGFPEQVRHGANNSARGRRAFAVWHRCSLSHCGCHPTHALTPHSPHLARWLALCHPFSFAASQLCSHYITQVLKGLQYLHTQGVIHRDIKGQSRHSHDRHSAQTYADPDALGCCNCTARCVGIEHMLLGECVCCPRCRGSQPPLTVPLTQTSAHGHRCLLPLCLSLPRISLLSPGANILSTKQGQVKLADFGVATKLSESRKSDSVVGTPYWSQKLHTQRQRWWTSERASEARLGTLAVSLILVSVRCTVSLCVCH